MASSIPILSTKRANTLRGDRDLEHARLRNWSSWMPRAMSGPHFALDIEATGKDQALILSLSCGSPKRPTTALHCVCERLQA